MATRNRRNEWHQVQGKWTRSLGDRGLRVRLFQKRKGGTFYREVWVSGRGKDRRSLDTSDRAEADRRGKLLYAELLKEQAPLTAGSVRLRRLWDEFRTKSQRFLDNKLRSRRDAETRAATLIGFFDEDCDVRRLTPDDQLRYQRQRVAGGIRYSRDGVFKKDERGSETEELEVFVTPVTRARSAEADLVLLHTILLWATTHRTPDGRFWLDVNPLRGVPRAPERNPVRPVATWDRFVATRAAVQRLAARYEARSPDWMRWVKVELALVLAEATGRRLGAIRQLRWEDVDFAHAEITWRADSDTKGVMWVVPLPDVLLEELREFQRRLGTIGGWVFAGERCPDQPMDRHLFDKWLAVAEREAKLPKLAGGLWHPYRRKWAMERKQLPLSDVAAVGGWKDIDTLLKCDSQADRRTMLNVMSEPTKLRSADVSAARVPPRDAASLALGAQH